MRIVSFKGTLRIHVLNYVTSLVILGIHALICSVYFTGVTTLCDEVPR